MPIMIVGLFSYTSTITNCALSRVRALNEHSEESVFCLKKHRQGFLLRSHPRSSSPTCTLNVAVVLASILMPLLYWHPFFGCSYWCHLYFANNSQTNLHHSPSDLWNLKYWKNQNLESEDSVFELGESTSWVTLINVIF